jgi:hypothetical protein
MLSVLRRSMLVIFFAMPCIFSQSAFSSTLTAVVDGDIVSIRNGDREMGRFSNLIVDESSVYSSISSTADGGLVLSISSNASRNKYEIVIPIMEREGKLFTNCIYKSVYDAVDGGRSIGTSCALTPLKNFDIFSAISDRDLHSYVDVKTPIGQPNSERCPDSRELDGGPRYSAYRVVLCGRKKGQNAGEEETIVLDHSGNTLFSVIGYIFFPEGNNGYALYASAGERPVVFRGKLDCFAHQQAIRNFNGKGEVGRYPIRYDINISQGCVVGSYSYENHRIPIEWVGVQYGNRLYLTELQSDRAVSGLFVVNEDKDHSAKGIWISTPPSATILPARLDAPDEQKM